MTNKITFDRKTRTGMFNAYGGRCGMNPSLTATQAHHIKHNTEINRRRWPLFIQSVFNLLPVNHNEHLSKPLPKAPSDLVCDEYERYLERMRNNEM